MAFYLQTLTVSQNLPKQNREWERDIGRHGERVGNGGRRWRGGSGGGEKEKERDRYNIEGEIEGGREEGGGRERDPERWLSAMGRGGSRLSWVASIQIPQNESVLNDCSRLFYCLLSQNKYSNNFNHICKISCQFMYMIY